MPEQFSYVIVGNGVAGATAAEILRNEDDAAQITVIADDPFPVYYRPALKDYLAGRVHEDRLWARPTTFYQDFRIRFISARVTGIQAGQHTVQLADGRPVPYSRLLLSNGARAARLTCPGADLKGVTTLRTVADYQAVMQQLPTARRVVVAGSGTLALETIETLRHRGYQVTHLLRKRILWSEVLDATASDLVLQQERRDGVDVRQEEEVAEVTGKDGCVTGIVTTGGARIPCDLLIVAIGVEPIIDFIKSSGIPCGRGVRVDAAMRTQAPDIYAAGDVLETTDAVTGRTRVIGQWYPAVQQARAAAYSMLDLLDTAHPFRFSTFYNATFLYGLDFASAGVTRLPANIEGCKELVADPLPDQPRNYRKVILKGSVPIGILTLGSRKDALAFKRAIDHAVDLTPILSILFAPAFSLNTWLDQQNVPPPVLGVTREGALAVKQAAYGAAAGGTTIFAPTLQASQPLKEAVLIPVPSEKAGQAAAARPATPGEILLPRNADKVITIGRQAGIHLLIDHPSVSRRHAEIMYANAQYLLRDVGSSNGTFVNNARLSSDSVQALQTGDILRFGHVSYSFTVRELAGQSPTVVREGRTKRHEMTTGFYDPTAMAEGRLPQGQPILNADGSLLLPEANRPLTPEQVTLLRTAPALVVIIEGTPRLYSLQRKNRIVLGRDPACDIVLEDAATSRKHAELFFGPGGFYVRDLGGSNGVFVNQTKIDNPYLLASGDRIAIASITMYYLFTGNYAAHRT